MENSSYISHHGILGMKWGQRNGPPYPLGPSDHSASEKKAGWKDSLKGSKSDKDFTDAARKSRLRKSKQKIVGSDGTVYGEDDYKKLKSQKKLAKQVVRNTKVVTGRTYSLQQPLRSKKYKYRDLKNDKVKDMDSVKKVFDDLSAAREKYKNASKVAQDYWKLSDKQRDALVERTVDWIQKDKSQKGLYSDQKREDLIRWYKYDDGDQGDHSTFAKYCLERGTTHIKESNKSWKAEQKYKAEQKKAVDGLLGEYGDMPVRKLSTKNSKTSVKDIVNSTLDNMLYEDEYKRRYGVPY